MEDQTKCEPGPLTAPHVALQTLLTLENLSRSFLMNDGTTFFALKDLSLTVQNIEHKPQIVIG